MSTWIGIQARSGSTRLPGKVLKYINGRTILDHVYTRCKQAHPSVFVLVPEGDVLEGICREIGYNFFIGSETDVLKRYYDFSMTRYMDYVIRITSDCPLINPANIVYTRFLQSTMKADFISNCILPCIDGQEVESISKPALAWVHENATGEHREHVTTYIKEDLSRFRAAGFSYYSWTDGLADYAPKMSVDTINDFKNLSTIMRRNEC